MSDNRQRRGQRGRGSMCLVPLNAFDVSNSMCPLKLSLAPYLLDSGTGTDSRLSIYYFVTKWPTTVVLRYNKTEHTEINVNLCIITQLTELNVQHFFLLFFLNSFTLSLMSHHNVHSVNEARLQEMQYLNLYSYCCLINH